MGCNIFKNWRVFVTKPIEIDLIKKNMTRSKILSAFVFLLILSSSHGQGLFYWPQVSPAEGGTVSSSIVLRAEESILEHYQAVPAPGYVFDSWSLYPQGEQAESLFVHTYDPRLITTLDIKIITARFIKEDTVSKPLRKVLEISHKKGNKIELSVFSQLGVGYIIYNSSNMKDWSAIGTGQGDGEEQVWTFPTQQGRNGFYRLLKLGAAERPESAVFGELSYTGTPQFGGEKGTALVRLWEYDPRIADKAAELFAEQTIEEIPIGPGLKRFRFELGDQTKAQSDRSYYITAVIYRKGKVGDANAQMYFLNGFNTIDIPSEFSAMLR